MINVTVKFGATGSVNKSFTDPITVGEIINDSNLRAFLGYPESVAAVIDGETVSQDTYVNDCDEILLEKQAAAKAA